jgi:hypothetical protein
LNLFRFAYKSNYGKIVLSKRLRNDPGSRRAEAHLNPPASLDFAHSPSKLAHEDSIGAGDETVRTEHLFRSGISCSTLRFF